MDRKRIGVIAAVVALCAVVLAVFVIVAKPLDTSNSVEKASANPTEQTLATDSPALRSPLGEKASTPAKRRAVWEYLKEKGYKRNEFCFTICVEHKVDRGASSVAEEAILTNEDLRQFLNGDNDRAKAARERARRVLSKGAYVRWLTAEDHVRVQFKIPIPYSQNSAYKDGTVVLTGGGRKVPAGDILFVFVEKNKKTKDQDDYKPNEEGNVRGDCGNPHAVPGSPGGPSKPSSPPPGSPPPGSPPPSSPPPGSPPPGSPPPSSPPPGTPFTPPPPPGEKPKRDTPSSVPGPTGNGRPQPPSETQVPGTQPGNPTPAPGTTVPFRPPPVAQPPAGDSPPAGDGGTQGGPL